MKLPDCWCPSGASCYQFFDQFLIGHNIVNNVTRLVGDNIAWLGERDREGGISLTPPLDTEVAPTYSTQSVSLLSSKLQ